MTDDIFSRDLVGARPALRAFLFKTLGRFGRLMELDDIAQDTCLKAWQMRDQYTPGTNFKAWLMTIARNHVISTGRRSFRTVQWDDDAHPQMLTTKPAIEGVIELRAVQTVLKQLTPEHREAIVLAADGCTTKEMAETWGMPMGTVKSRLCRAREDLRRKLKRHHRPSDQARDAMRAMVQRIAAAA